MGRRNRDPDEQKFLLGRIPVNRNAREHNKIKSGHYDRKAENAAKRRIAALEKERDKQYKHSAKWKEYDKTIQQLKKDYGL